MSTFVPNGNKNIAPAANDTKKPEESAENIESKDVPVKRVRIRDPFEWDKSFMVDL